MRGPETLTPHALHRLHDRLLATWGAQHWWPADDPFEIMVGAVLVQRTRWQRAAAAIEVLRAANALTPEGILAHADLPAAVHGAGPHRIKADRLRQLAHWWLDAGGLEALAILDTATLRHRLLAVRGIGPETADVILLYVFQRPQFVADAYAFRVLGRYGWTNDGTGYETLRRKIEAAGPDDPAFFNELHALLVAHGKHCCHSRAPACDACALRDTCRRIGL